MTTETNPRTDADRGADPGARPGTPVWLELTTDDTQAARDFYRELFGWRFSEPEPELGGYVDIKAGDSSVGGLLSSADMECPEGGEIPNSWDVYLAVSDAQLSAQQAQDAGARLLVGPHDAGASGRFAMLLDPAGAAIGLWQARTFAGFTVTGAPGTPVWFESMSMDFDAALPFYREVLWWDVAWMDAEGGSDGFRYVTHGSGESSAAGLCDASGFFPEATPSFWRVYFAVEDADASVATVQRLGGTLVSEAIDDSPFGRFATVADPTGATFLINQPPPAR